MAARRRSALRVAWSGTHGESADFAHIPCLPRGDHAGPAGGLSAIVGMQGSMKAAGRRVGLRGGDHSISEQPAASP
jgi:hypothetical protein